MLFILPQASDYKLQYIDEQMLARLSLLKPNPTFTEQFYKVSPINNFW